MTRNSKMKLRIIIFFLLTVGCSSPDLQEKTTITKDWMGTWERRIWQNDGFLNINRITNDSLEFSLSAASGGNLGEIESGFASVNKNTATYMSINEGDTCLILFTLIGDSAIIIDQKVGTCYTGMGVTYSGYYKNKKLLPSNEISETLYDLEVLQSKKQDSLFKLMTGDSYSLFVNSTQLTTDDEEDLDSLHSIVRKSGVRGLFTYMENIVMVDSSNNFWAAVIDDKKVLYFTNSNKFNKELPKTIDKWREKFSDLEVVFK